MALATCPHCHAAIDDNALLCPECGQAQVPQLSKAQLRLINLGEERATVLPLALGCGAGLLAGVLLLLAVLLVKRDGFDFTDPVERRIPGALVLGPAMLGGMLALVACVLRGRWARSPYVGRPRRGSGPETRVCAACGAPLTDLAATECTPCALNNAERTLRNGP